MSLTGTVSAAPALSRRILVALAALALVAAGFALAGWLASLWSPPAPPPPRNPFGAALPREALPATTGVFGLLLAWQAQFYRELTATLKAIALSPAAFWSLLGLAFAYGVFHAAGPGHGKAVISAYIVVDDRSLRRGLGLSLAAALLQAVVAIVLVGTLTLALKATAASMNRVTDIIEQASFAGIALVGLWLVWRKAGAVVALGRDAPAHDAGSCGHVHLPGPDEIARLGGLRQMAGVVLAAGLRPCAGALIVLVFAASQGLLWAGVAAAFAMAFGTALTTGAIAAFAVFFKFAALRLAGRGGAGAARALAGLELLAGALLAVLGAGLLLGWLAGLQGG